MPRTRVTKMHLLLLMIMLMMGCSVLTDAQTVCDPLTQYQYEKNGTCCKMCGPGTRMLSIVTCQDPQCTDCGDNEYQDKYTSETRCHRQPYCDPHKNFDDVVSTSKKIQSTCKCKGGFHCSSEECISCVPHTPCGPGHRVRSIGNHTHNTVCQKCAEGTFSEDNSWSDVCKKWTECVDGYHVEKKGTDVSDNICEATPRSHAAVIAVVCFVIVLLLGVMGACWYCQCKGNPGDATGKVKACFESCLGDEQEPPRETKVLITNPTGPTEEESMSHELLSQEEAGVRTPEENEDELSQELPSDLARTENGNFVTQENGKSSVLSRQESQPQTFTD